MKSKQIQRWPVRVVLDALIAYHAKRLAADPEFKQAHLAEEMSADQSNLSRWLSRKARPRGSNFSNLVTFLKSVGALPKQPA